MLCCSLNRCLHSKSYYNSLFLHRNWFISSTICVNCFILQAILICRYLLYVPIGMCQLWNIVWGLQACKQYSSAQSVALRCISPTWTVPSWVSFKLRWHKIALLELSYLVVCDVMQLSTVKDAVALVIQIQWWNYRMSDTGWHLLCFSLRRYLIQLQPVLRDGTVLLTGPGNIRSKNTVGLAAGRTW